MILEILTVAGLATFEIYAAIPAGFIFGLSPWVIFFASVTGGLLGAIVAAFFFTPLLVCSIACERRTNNQRE